MAARSGDLTRRNVLAIVPTVAIAQLGFVGAQQINDETVDRVPVEKIPLILTALIRDHCAVCSELDHISHQTDPVILGYEPDAGEWQKLEMTSDRERDLLMKLCAFPARTDAERYAKASYLLAIFDGSEPSSEHISTILRSMMCGRMS